MTSRILNILGTCVLVGIILVSIPFLMPKVMGLQVYTVLTGSMEPDYPAGSIIYVKSISPSDVQEGDVITYNMGEGSKTVTTHRVVSIDEQQQTFVTKGDANDAVDAIPVGFSRLMGKAVFKIPYLGNYSQFIQSTPGIFTGIFLFVLSILLWTAGYLLAHPKKK